MISLGGWVRFLSLRSGIHISVLLPTLHWGLRLSSKLYYKTWQFILQQHLKDNEDILTNIYQYAMFMLLSILGIALSELLPLFYWTDEITFILILLWNYDLSTLDGNTQILVGLANYLLRIWLEVRFSNYRWSITLLIAGWTERMAWLRASLSVGWDLGWFTPGGGITK